MRVLLFLSLFSSLFLHTHASTQTWQGVNGNWNGQVILSEQWSGGIVPGPNDDVIIGVGAPSPFSVQFAVDTAFQSMTLAAGTHLVLNGHTLTLMTLTIDYSQGVANSPITIDGGVLIIQQGWNMNNLKATQNPDFVLSGTTVLVKQGCNVQIGAYVTNITPSLQLILDFRTTNGNSSSIINYGDFRIMGNMPIIWNGASDMTSAFTQPSDANGANFVIQRTATMLDPNYDGSRLLSANNMKFQIMAGMVQLMTDNTLTINASAPLPNMDLTNYTNTLSKGMVIELPTSTGGSGSTSSTWLLSYPAQLSCSSPIRTVSIRSVLQIYGSRITCEATIFQSQAVVTLMTPSDVGMNQGSPPGIINWMGILISGAKEFNLNGNTLQISQMTTAFSYPQTSATIISNGVINVNQLWMIQDLYIQSSINQLTLKGVSIFVQQGASWHIGAYMNGLSTTTAFTLLIELLSSGSTSSSISNRGLIKIMGNAPIQWTGNNDINTYYEQPLGASNAQLILERTNNVAGRDASNILTISGIQVRILDGAIMLAADINHLTTSPPPNLAPSQFEEAVTNGMVQTLPTLVSGSGRFILSYPARVLCSSFIMTAVVRGTMEIWGASFQCPSVAFASKSNVLFRSPSEVSWNREDNNTLPQPSNGGIVYWNETTLLISGTVDMNGYQWKLRELITDFRVMGVIQSTTISNAQVYIASRWTVNSYTTTTSGINYHKVVLDNTQVIISQSTAIMSYGPQTPSTTPGALSSIPKPLLISSSSSDVNSPSSGLTVYGQLYGFGSFKTALGIPMTFKPGSVIDLQPGSGVLHLWSNAVFGATSSPVVTVRLASGTSITFEGARYDFPSFSKEGFGTIVCLSSAVLNKSPSWGCSSTVSTIASTSYGAPTSNPSASSTGINNNPSSSTGGSNPTSSPPTGSMSGTTTRPTNNPNTGSSGSSNPNTGSSGASNPTTPTGTETGTGSSTEFPTDTPTDTPTNIPSDSSSGMPTNTPTSGTGLTTSTGHGTSIGTGGMTPTPTPIVFGAASHGYDNGLFITLVMTMLSLLFAQLLI